MAKDYYTSEDLRREIEQEDRVNRKRVAAETAKSLPPAAPVNLPLPLPPMMQGTFGPPVEGINPERQRATLNHIDNIARSQFELPYTIAEAFGWENVEQDIGPRPDPQWVQENPLLHLGSSFVIPGAGALGAAKLGYKGYKMLPPGLQRLIEFGIAAPASVKISDQLGLLGP